MDLCLHIGVKNADENELRAIASKPEDTHVYNVADFSIMSTIVDGLTKTVCEGVEQQDKEINREWFFSFLFFELVSMEVDLMSYLSVNRRRFFASGVRDGVTATGLGYFGGDCTQFPCVLDSRAWQCGKIPGGLPSNQYRSAGRGDK